MKKEIEKLLKAEEATLKINELFILRHWTLNPDNDFLGRKGDFLKLEMINPEGVTRAASVDIISRKTADIMKEVGAAIETMINEYKENLLRRWRGGLI